MTTPRPPTPFKRLQLALQETETLSHAEQIMREVKHLRREGKITQKQHAALRQIFTAREYGRAKS